MLDPYLLGKVKDLTIIGARLSNQLDEFQPMLAAYVDELDKIIMTLETATATKKDPHP